MPRAKITGPLQKRLAELGENFPLSSQELVDEFTYWREHGPASSCWFGRTVGSEPPDKLRHTHFAPYDPEEFDRWSLKHRRRSFHNMVSNGYVLWANDPAHGDLLIDVIVEPHAHDLWRPQAEAQLAAYEVVADNFCFNGTVP